jgi:hypothetical protein
LRGVSQDEFVLDDRPHELNAAGAVSLRRGLLAMLDAYCGSAEQTAARGGTKGFADEVFGLIADAYLCAWPRSDTRDRR